MNRTIVVSTGNLNKIKEIKEIFEGLPIDIVSKGEIGFEDFEIEEDGTSLYENSLKKAQELKNHTSHMVMSDDSGLFVESLNGAPGVYSSRYAGEEGNDKKNNIKLLEELKGLENRKAYFKSVIILLDEDGNIIEGEGTCNGKIGKSPKGENGFGYDPLFIPEGYEKTFGELGHEIKNNISHRKKALEDLRIKLEKYLK